jgi:hypothetical protein
MAAGGSRQAAGHRVGARGCIRSRAGRSVSSEDCCARLWQVFEGNSSPKDLFLTIGDDYG